MNSQQHTATTGTKFSSIGNGRGDGRKSNRWPQPRNLAFAVAIVLASCSPPPVADAPKAATPPPQAVPASPALLAAGQEVYETYCAQCHFAGEGNELNPSLIGSAVVAGPPADFIKVVLKGRQGESVVNGKKLDGMMPAQDYLTDDEIAAVVTYVRKQFGPGGPAVTAKEVAAQR